MSRVERNNKIYLRNCSLDEPENFSVTYLDSNGNRLKTEKYSTEWPFRKHKLEGGPLNGNIVYVRKNRNFYSYEENGVTYSYSGLGKRDYCFTFDCKSK